ncbi:hypothetical protein Pint_08490 [Pistacia integerrima]|uniref:Uncharacterized protein n=1 Tax=Pistacia integerrima TaxID=434235 RepID=A0ACC0XTU3_9ROSI|nr:hypothetical protein Pint_08490 [Pistacia integerrima]
MTKSYENFVKSLELPSTGSTFAAFTTSHSSKFASARGGGRASRGGRHQRNRPIRCQIFRRERHYATSCRDRYSHSSNVANLVKAFTSCTLNDNQASNWYTDTGAITHMTNDDTQLDKSDTYIGKDRVIVGNGASLPISHTGTLSPTSSLTLKDVLVVPALTKNLISINKLTSDFPFSITFTNDRFIIHNQVIRKVVATGRREDGTPCSRPLPNSSISAFLEPSTIPGAELPTQPDPIPRPCGSCLTDPSASFVPLSILQAPDVEPTIPLVHEPLHASTLMPADLDLVNNVSSLTTSSRPPLIGTHLMQT